MSLAEQFVGIALRRPRHFWTKEQDSRVRELFGCGALYEDIAASISLEFNCDIGRKSARDRRYNLGLTRELTDWRPEIDAELLRLVASGVSYREAVPTINDRYGTSFSRCALIGRARRLGEFEPRRKVTPEEKAARKAAREQRHNAKRREVRKEAGHVPRLRIVRPAREATVLRCAEIEPRHVSLLDLERDQCRYPYGDGPFTFCGHQAGNGTSYCMPHFHLTLAPRVA